MITDMKNSQEKAFVKSEADNWYIRNRDVINVPVDESNPHLSMEILRNWKLAASGRFIDLGGGNGRVAAYFKNIFPSWEVFVLEPSGKAIEAGKALFPNVNFYQGSITEKCSFPPGSFDICHISGVLCWIDRNLLSLAVSNIDAILADEALLSITDFYTTGQRANPYAHHTGIFTYKQDYSLPFLGLGTYSLVSALNRNVDSHTSSDSHDAYDAYFSTFLIQKDLYGRYRKS